MADNSLVIKITGDIKDFQGKLSEITGATEDFNLSLTAIAGIAAAAFATVVAGITYSVEKYGEQERATNKLVLALQNQGIYSDALLASYKQQAEELSRLTGYENTTITSGQALLQSMIGQREITKEMTEAALNLGTAMGGDVNAGFEVIGRAIDGNTRGLRQFGITIDEHLTKEERTAQVLQKVGVAFGGLAAKTNEGLGSIRGLKSAIGEVAEDVGQRFAPAITGSIGLLTEFFRAMHEGTKANTNPFASLDTQIDTLQAKLDNIKKNPYYAVQTGVSEEQIKRETAALVILKAQRDEMARGAGKRGQGQDPEKKAEADRVHAIEVDQQNRTQAALRAHDEYIKAEIQGHTKEVVDLYKEEAQTTQEIADNKNVKILQQLRDHLQVIRDLRKDAQYQEIEQNNTFEDEKGVLFEKYAEMSLAQQQAFNQKEKKEITSSILTRDQARKQEFTTELKERIKNHNTMLLEEAKYGKAYALIHSLMHSEIYQGSKQAFGELAQLQTSSNSTLKGIGKVAAIASIIIKTAESAMNIYAGFSTIPIIGPVLGVAGAAAAVAFGAEQIGTVTAAAQGGLITGGIPGIDSVPLLAQHGELVVPQKNFNEVVEDAARRKSGSGDGGMSHHISISMNGKEAESVLTARQTEAKRLGTYSGI